VSARSNLIALTAAVGAAGAAWGLSDVVSGPRSRAAGYTQIGSPTSPRCQTITSTETTTTILRDHLSAIPACFPLGSKIMLKSRGGDAAVVVSMSVDVTMQGDIGDNDGLYLRDPNGADGQAAWGAIVSDGETAAYVLGQQQILVGPGARTGYCTTQVRTPGLYERHPPCRVDGDCTTLAGGGTCVTSGTDATRQARLAQGCGFMRVKVGTAGAQVCAWLDE